MPISKVTAQNFNKGWSITTGAGNYELPRSDTDSLYGPGWPIQPMTRPEDSELPRTFDYPVGINYTLQPRVGYAGLMPIAALKAAYTNIAEVSNPVNILIRELSGFMPMLRDPKSKQKVKAGHPFHWMTVAPDRDTPFNIWLSKYKKSSKVYAAPAFFLKRENGMVSALEYIDGSTLFLIINDRGNLPRPDELDVEVLKFAQAIQAGRVDSTMPALVKDYLTKQQARINQGKPQVTTTPAFTQIIKGIPFSFWDRSQIYFAPEPPAPAVDSPYGESFIERAWTWINIIATMTSFELAHYRTGNTPEGLMVMPKEMFPSMAKLATGEREWNARMAEGSQVQHARNRWMPEGTQYIPTKSPDFPADLYKQANQNILFALGMPPSEMGDKPGAGLGGKGFAEGAANDVTRQLLEVEKESFEDAFNYVLAKEGVTDAEFYLDYPQEEIDPTQQQEDLWNKFSRGIATLNDVLTTQGKQPLGDPHDLENVANLHLLISGTTIFVLEKVKPDENGIISASGGQQPNFGGSPQNPEDLIMGDKKGVPPKKGFPQAVAKAIESTGSLSNVTYSIPALYKGEPEGHPFRGNQWTEGKKTSSSKLPSKLHTRIDELANILGYKLQEKKIERGYVLNSEGEVLQTAIGTQKRGQHEINLSAGKGEITIHSHPTDKGFSMMDVKSAAEADLAAAVVVTSERIFILEPGENGWVGTSEVQQYDPHVLTAEMAERLGLIYSERDVNKSGAYYWKKSEGSYDALDREKWSNGVVEETEEHGDHFDEAEIEQIVEDHLDEDPDYYKGELQKHCGVCPEDADYAYSPIEMVNPTTVRILSDEPRIAKWIPADDQLSAEKEEAAWLLDRSLGFGLVPVAYVTENPEGQRGAVVLGDTLQKDSTPPSADWLSKASILDYLLGLPLRQYITHPDEPGRIISPSNSKAFPLKISLEVPSTEGHEFELKQTKGDLSLWSDLSDLLGEEATQKTQDRLETLLGE